MKTLFYFQNSRQHDWDPICNFKLIACWYVHENEINAIARGMLAGIVAMTGRKHGKIVIVVDNKRIDAISF